MQRTQARARREALLLRLVGAQSLQEGKDRLEEIEVFADRGTAAERWIEVILALRDEDRIGDQVADFLIDRFVEGAADRMQERTDDFEDLAGRIDVCYRGEGVVEEEADARECEARILASHLDPEDAVYETDQDEVNDNLEPFGEVIGERRPELEAQFLESIGQGVRGSALVNDAAAYYADVESGLAMMRQGWWTRELQRAS